MEGFFRDYFAYAGESEVPDTFNRWTAISLVSSIIGRQAYLVFGHKELYPNTFILLQGQPASRKSTAISIGTRLLKATGYARFASDRMSRQTFLDEMARINQPDNMGIPLEQQFEMPLDYPYEMTVHANEFIDFIGQNDKDYLMLLTNLYDNLPEYSNPKLSSKSVIVRKPTINFIGGSTPENLNMAFPSTAMDTGTLSRILFIHSNPSPKKILIPQRPPPEAMVTMLNWLAEIKKKVQGAFTITEDALSALDYIYQNFEPLEDSRFSFYSGRRLDHLLKLSMIMAATRLSTTMDIDDVVTANSILGVAEFSMHKALGHFGRSKQSTIMHSIIEYMETVGKPVVLKELYTVFVSDFNKETEFMSMIMDMQNSGRIRAVNIGTEEVRKPAFEVVKKKLPKWIAQMIVPDVLTDQELHSVGMTR